MAEDALLGKWVRCDHFDVCGAICGHKDGHIYSQRCRIVFASCECPTARCELVPKAKPKVVKPKPPSVDKVRKIHRLLKKATSHFTDNQDEGAWDKAMDALMEARKLCAQITRDKP